MLFRGLHKLLGCLDGSLDNFLRRFDGAFDNFAADNLFKATFGGSFGSISFGTVLDAGIAQETLATDLTVVGSLAGGGDLGEVDLVYIPEPSSLLVLTFAAVCVGLRKRRSR